MGRKKIQREPDQASNQEAAPLPPGVKLFRTLQGHHDAVTSVAFGPRGETSKRKRRGKPDETPRAKFSAEDVMDWQE